MVNWPWVCLSQQTERSQGWQCLHSPVLPQHIPRIINAADIVQAVPSTVSHPQPQRPAEWMGWAPSPRPGPLVLLAPREGGERLWEVLWPQAEATIWGSHANNPERASLQGEEKGQMHWDRQRKGNHSPKRKAGGGAACQLPLSWGSRPLAIVCCTSSLPSS